MEAPEFYQTATAFCPQLVPDKRQYSSDNKTAAAAAGDHFVVEEFLDFSNEDAVIADAAGFNPGAGAGAKSTDSSPVTVVDSCNSSNFSGCEPNFLSDVGRRSFADGQFSSELCVPAYDDLAELEWVSNFVEESFTSEDLQRLQLISGLKAQNDVESSQLVTNRNNTNNINNNFSNANNNAPVFNSDHVSVPAKARSKRSRAPPCNWKSRLLLVSATTSSNSSSPPDHDVVVSAQPPPPPPPTTAAKKNVKAASKKKDTSSNGPDGEGRKCLHCATDKTPQWRTGPMGPKTLCNACGVRYKSGRLVPEYRPAASPTFVLTKHSNSHRKVLELRRQKEFLRAQQHQQQFFHHPHQNGMVFDHASSNGEDYLIHQHVGPDFRQMI